MSSGEKWQHIPTKNRKSNHSDEADRHKTAGLSHSSAPFSRYSQQRRMTEENSEEFSMDSEPAKPPPPSPRKAKGQQSTAKKPPVAPNKKAKLKKQSLEECVAQLDAEHILELVNSSQESEYDHLSGLKEIQGYLQSVLGNTEQEKDYTFPTKPPGYPLTLLPGNISKTLLKVIRGCSAAAQEKAFVYCVDRLLSDLGAGSSTWGTRVMMLLLIKCNHSVCVEAGRIIKIHLQSNISKVPEALSLLWAGLPHPQFHLSTAIRMWPDLCLPLFHHQNLPKQVFNYMLQYTSMLLEVLLEREDKSMLLDLLNPSAMCQILRSHQLYNKRLLRNVQDFLASVPDAVIDNSSDASLADYFREMYKHLPSENNTFLVSFVIACLNRSGASWEVWPSISSSPPASSSILLEELQQAGSIETLPLPVREWADIMTKLSYNIPTKDRPLVKKLVAKYCTAVDDSRMEVVDDRGDGSGRWCSGCGFLVVLLCIAYLCVLSFILYRVSTEGPGTVFKPFLERLDVQWVDKAWHVVAVVLDYMCSYVVK